MDFSESSYAGSSGRSNPSLAVSRSSFKINKGMRKPPIQPKPTPPPRIYNTDPTSFRNLVQELTGTAPAAPFVVAASPLNRPVNKRLQKIAPPPLQPTFPLSRMLQQQQQQQPLPLSPILSPTLQKYPLSFNNHSPLAKILSPVPTHRFSPFPVLTPADGMWSNPLDSPDTAAIRHLAQKMVESQNASPKIELVSDPPAAFPRSPSFQSCFGLYSPGMFSGRGFGNIYTGLGISDSPSSHAINSFTFSEADFVSGFSYAFQNGG
ncbi:hypothetical protein O6H91_05G099400 [Diphasiastrum complanatum]|uniref:Uncharacterized protein n=1 Tax=Diphasiastrum complanatum TaxID=34168 RepID=A0ACC2DRA1_DIPCM|nr:hypothetical protein O6H91_05G099400 [Diphasiastrum complanatum]